LDVIPLKGAIQAVTDFLNQNNIEVKFVKIDKASAYLRVQ